MMLFYQDQIKFKNKSDWFFTKLKQTKILPLIFICIIKYYKSCFILIFKITTKKLKLQQKQTKNGCKNFIF